MHFDVTDTLKLDPEQPWQKLECILSVWIEMIQRQKVVALHRDVGESRFEHVEGDIYREIKGPERDPATGAARLNVEMQPWTVAPWAAKDLKETLEVWHLAVRSIEQKMSLPESGSLGAALVDTETLDAARVPDGFTRQFLSKAQRPRFKFIAPGLRVPTAGELVIQPLIDVPGSDEDPSDQQEVAPILLFRGDASVSTAELGFFYPYSGPSAAVSECLCGLYMDYCDRRLNIPFEDGCRLVFPFRFAQGWARQSDGSRALAHDSLFQSGVNPYSTVHSVQLQAFLENVYMNVQREHWTVDTAGVAGGIDVWKDADTEQRWSSYQVPLGPGRYW